MAPKVTLTPLDYELPKTPKEVMDAWMPRLQAVAVVTALLAGTEAQLLGSLPERPNNISAADTTLRFFAYSGLLLNLGATLSTILLLIAVASLPTTARQVYVSCSHGYPRKVFHNHQTHLAELNKRLLDGHGETYILRAFGIARGWSFMLRHCIACFMGGCVCTFTHISINLWLSESTVVAAILMPAVFFSFMPPCVAFLFYMGSPSCRECSEERRVAYTEV
ncbi:hypothetical protein D9615_008219 [Tricholomella constricta]|uniref:Uncharacterized protein n=1 Tax=Tricholomella constricta TaxID=117010 RepID=A0A8H5H3A1_9AGAR|nr:hypothetical protein D9615_008219 [Tricholomella constricta]